MNSGTENHSAPLNLLTVIHYAMKSGTEIHSAMKPDALIQEKFYILLKRNC
jgi:hypothetical protein